MNTYILLDDLNVVINTIEMPEEPVNQELINLLITQNSGSRFIKISDNQNEISSVECVQSENIPSIGFTWDGTGFLTPSPSPEFMLDYTGYNWIPIPPDISESGTFEWDPENLSWSEQ